MSNRTTGRRRRRRLLPAASLWLAVVILSLCQRAAAVHSSGDRGDGPSVSNVLWAVGALTAAGVAVAVLAGWLDTQLAVFGTSP